MKIYDSGNSNFEHISNENCSSLIMAINNGMLSLACKIIKDGSKELIGFVNKENDTALILAITKQFWDITHILIDTGYSNPGHVNNQNDTALILACSMNQVDICKKILLKNSDCNKYHKNNYNTSVLDIALHYNYTEIINLINNWK